MQLSIRLESHGDCTSSTVCHRTQLHILASIVFEAVRMTCLSPLETNFVHSDNIMKQCAQKHFLSTWTKPTAAQVEVTQTSR